MISFLQQNFDNPSISDMESMGEVFFTVHQIAACLGNAIDARDPFTSSHSKQVADLSRCLAIKAGFSQREVEIIHIAGHMHDIGKIGIPDKILCKNGPLDPEEWKMMWMHPVIGARIVAPVKVMGGITGISRLILHHHERFDGKGYPDGLKADKIPPGARILALADSISAMLEDRPYRKRLTLCQTMEQIRQGSGTQFDPELSAMLLNMLDSVGSELKVCSLNTLVTKIICKRVMDSRSCKKCSKFQGIRMPG
ncbi:MAG: HD-GYP domain-containing protein [Desulfonatronovibrio sp.]